MNIPDLDMGMLWENFRKIQLSVIILDAILFNPRHQRFYSVSIRCVDTTEFFNRRICEWQEHLST